MNNLDYKRKETLDRIRYNSNLKKYFFRKLALTTNPFPWLEDLMEDGYFDPESYPIPQKVEGEEEYYIIPYWEPSGFLENLAKLNSENPDLKYTDILLDIINNFINHDFGENRNYRMDYTFIKIIFSLPKDKITIDHVCFVSTALNSKGDTTLIQSELSKTVTKKLIDYKLKDFFLILLGILLDYKISSDKYNVEYISIMDEFWFNKTLSDCKSAIAEFAALDSVRIALAKISEILAEDETQFSYVLIPAIEDHPQTLLPKRYEVQMVYFVRDMFDYLYSDGNYSLEIRNCAEEFATSEKKIFKRIAIYLINLDYDNLNDIFWSWPNPLDDIDLRHDIYRLLNLNYSKFEDDSEKIDILIDWINTKQYIVKMQKEDAEPAHIAYQKLRWLLALEASGNPKIQSLIKDYKELCPDEIDHPDFGVWTSGLIVSSPKYSDELCTKSNNKLASYLIHQNGVQSHFEKSDISESFIKCVSDVPEKFTTDLNPFLSVSRENQYNLIYGLYSAARSRKTFEFSEIFDFILKIIENNEFWEEDYTDENNYRNWIISAVADFIETIIESDNNHINKDLLVEAEKILLILVNRVESDLQDMHDLVTSVLNSSLGKIFSAMIVLSLKCVRLLKKFPNNIKLELEKRMTSPPTELSVTLGKFLPHLYFSDKEWVITNINLIFPDDDEIWKHAFIGYLFYSSQIYSEIYKLLKETGHYERAIFTDFEDRNITQRLIQHISVLYLTNKEDLNDSNSLITKLVDYKNPEQISLLIQFISSTKQSKTNQIKELWSKIFDKFSIEGNKNCEVIANLSRWLELVEEIDGDIFEWLKTSAECMTSHTSMGIFIETLTKYVDKSPEEVGTIFIKMLDKFPEHKEEDIIKIVDTLFQKEQTKMANYICKEYKTKGFDFLKDVYKQYNL